jgi:hypothetical protein
MPPDKPKYLKKIILDKSTGILRKVKRFKI